MWKMERGVGIVYWEPEWLPIPECAWAKKIGCEYMNDKAELGNSWANQALFDASGNANRALINFSTMVEKEKVMKRKRVMAVIFTSGTYSWNDFWLRR